MRVYIADASADKIISSENVNNSKERWGGGGGGLYIYVQGLQLICSCSYMNFFPWMNFIFLFWLNSCVAGFIIRLTYMIRCHLIAMLELEAVWYSICHKHFLELKVFLVCSTCLMALLIRSVGGLSKCFYQGLWLADLNADVIGQSIDRRGVT